MRYTFCTIVCLMVASISGAEAAEIDVLKEQILLLTKQIEKLTKENELRKLQNRPSSPKKITIKSAEYGLNGNTCAATGFIRASCNGLAKCEPLISNAMCGDPAPTPTMKITIEYECNGQPETYVADEGTKAYLTCP